MPLRYTKSQNPRRSRTSTSRLGSRTIPKHFLESKSSRTNKFDKQKTGPTQSRKQTKNVLTKKRKTRGGSSGLERTNSDRITLMGEEHQDEEFKKAEMIVNDFLSNQRKAETDRHLQSNQPAFQSNQPANLDLEGVAKTFWNAAALTYNVVTPAIMEGIHLVSGMLETKDTEEEKQQLVTNLAAAARNSIERNVPLPPGLQPALEASSSSTTLTPRTRKT